MAEKDSSNTDEFPEDIDELVKSYRPRHGHYPVVVYTSGTFDLFHIGHLNVLQKSKALGDILVVGVSTDEKVASYKKKAPIIKYEDRVAIIKNLKCVDLVVKQEVLTDPRLLVKYGVSVVTIGDDWKTKSLPGMDWAKEHGLKTVYLPYTSGVSSTKIKETIASGGWQEDKGGVN